MGKFIRLKKGFTINLAGKAANKIAEIEPPDTVAIKPADFQGLYMPKLVVTEGDSVKAGSPLFHDKKFNKGQIIGGLIFGLGWAITGACPGPIFAQIGTGVTVMIVALFFAIVGTWVYGYFRDKLPH